MKLKNTLVGIVLAGALTLTGCEEVIHFPYDYTYNDTIGKDYVKFEVYLDGFFLVPQKRNLLTIRKPDGITIKYIDDNNEFIIGLVEVRNAKGDLVYQGRDKKILSLAQGQFDNYLKLIREAKEKGKQGGAIKKEDEQQRETKRLEEILKNLKQEIEIGRLK
ncbi:hypothetical protein HYX19_03205 [Candidatus Woesearchaeota archaeon]|nr:hypothetical protein [Candidatus Woesearchaeota archaeon]